MKRVWRITRSALFALIGGAVISVGVAEGIGVSGVVHTWSSADRWMVAVDGMYVRANETTGAGWTHLWWLVLDEEGAIADQFVTHGYEAAFAGEGDLTAVHCDPPGALPRWSRSWRPGNWPASARTKSFPRIPVVTEVAVGWPLRSLSMHCGQSPPYGWHGGMEVGAQVPRGMRVLLWRPIPLNLAADTLFYAVGLAGLVGVVQLGVRFGRRRRGACRYCAYDRRGLAAGSACPECGRAGLGAGVAT